MLESEDQRKNKAVHNQMREDKERSEGIQTCTVLVCSVGIWHGSHQEYQSEGPQGAASLLFLVRKVERDPK